MARRRLPSLTALRSFEAVARTLGFTAAARELGVTQAAVSRQVRRLEEDLGVQLVTRTPRGNSLTEAGEALFGELLRAFDGIARTLQRIVDRPGREAINVSVAPFFSARWLTPRLKRFFDRHPDIDLRLHHAYQPPDLRRQDIDLGINWGPRDWPGITAERVLDGALAPVLSADLAGRLGDPPAPERLVQLTLYYEFDLEDWRQWFAVVGLGLPATARTLRLDDSHALRQALLEGQGVGLVVLDLHREDLATGRLVRPFPETVNRGFDYYLNYRTDQPLPARCKAFRRWLMEEIHREPVA